MGELADKAASLGLVHETSLAITAVAVPELVFGAPFLDRWPIREMAGGLHWRDTAYRSYSPWVFTIPQARVHSTAGIVCVEGFVVVETLGHAAPDRHRYTPTADGIRIDAEAAKLAGTHVSALAPGAPENYYHTLLDAVGRLAVVPDAVLDAADGVLAAPGRDTPAAWLLARAADRWALRRTDVQEDTSLHVERLVLAGPHIPVTNFHPYLAAWFGTRAALADRGQVMPPAFYVQRGPALRPLLKEAELVTALRAAGVVPVRLEALGPLDQIMLFRNARLIIAPHGAGLANLAFARPGCRVLELQMDAYCNWCFRCLAAAKGLSYDCILGRAVGEWLDVSGPVHAMAWHVSVPHVTAAVQALAC